MKRQDEIKYLTIALRLQGVHINEEMTDRIIETHNEVRKLKGNFSIKDAVRIEVAMDNKYKEIEIKARKKNEND